MDEKESLDQTLESERAFASVAIVGLGLIGGSLAAALRRGGYRGRILGVSRPATIEEALARGLVDAGHPYEDLERATSEAELVVLATPISEIIASLRRLGARPGALRAGAIVSDVGSTKRAVVRAAVESLPAGVHFVGGHPLAGSEQRGLRAADPLLFENAYYVLTPAPGVPPEETGRLAGLIRLAGARAVVLSAEAHDRIAAAISHLPQVLAVSLVEFLDELGPEKEIAVRLAAGGFRDMTRIASSPYSVWRDILATNEDCVVELAGRFAERVRKAAGKIAGGSIERSFERAADTRAQIPRDTKGFLHALWDVLVVVEDRPGAIAAIASPLAERGINIADIEVVKVREGEAGTIRLGFGSELDAREAVRVLSAAGHQARLRE